MTSDGPAPGGDVTASVYWHVARVIWVRRGTTSVHHVDKPLDERSASRLNHRTWPARRPRPVEIVWGRRTKGRAARRRDARQPSATARSGPCVPPTSCSRAILQVDPCACGQPRHHGTSSRGLRPARPQPHHPRRPTIRPPICPQTRGTPRPFRGMLALPRVRGNDRSGRGGPVRDAERRRDPADHPAPRIGLHRLPRRPLP